MRTCTVEECERIHVAKKLCSIHYMRFKRNGTFKTEHPQESLNVRFHKQYIIESETDCWIWTGSSTKHQGYGVIKDKCKTKLAHRVSWELHNGPIPDGLNACHHCDTPACVNSDHLFLGTQKDNMHDAVKKGRVNGKHLIGENNNNVKITWEKVKEIRGSNKKGMSERKLAKEHGVDRKTIHEVCTHQTWKLVPAIRAYFEGRV